MLIINIMDLPECELPYSGPKMPGQLDVRKILD